LPEGRIISYQYDVNGNLTGITPPNRPVHQLRTPKNICPIFPNNLPISFCPPPFLILNFQFLILKSAKIITQIVMPKD
jgi:YD repeat-containing protein